MNKIIIYKEIFGLLLTEAPSDNLIEQYLRGDHLPLQEFCADKSKIKWATGLSILDAADLIIEGAIENANIKDEFETVHQKRERLGIDDKQWEAAMFQEVYSGFVDNCSI